MIATSAASSSISIMAVSSKRSSNSDPQSAVSCLASVELHVFACQSWLHLFNHWDNPEFPHQKPRSSRKKTQRKVKLSQHERKIPLLLARLKTAILCVNAYFINIKVIYCNTYFFFSSSIKHLCQILTRFPNLNMRSRLPCMK